MCVCVCVYIYSDGVIFLLEQLSVSQEGKNSALCQLLNWIRGEPVVKALQKFKYLALETSMI